MLFGLIIGGSSKFTCKNAQGRGVDWYVVAKAPKLNSYGSDFALGAALFYQDRSTGFTKLSSNINSDKNPLAQTLKPLYSGESDDDGYVLIQDQPPNGTCSASHAHMKGVLLFDKDGGVYIEHSAPKFPPHPKMTSQYSYPTSASVYGQTFMCLNLDKNGVKSLGKTLLINRPGVYGYSLPTFVSSMYPELRKVADQQWDSPSATTKTVVSVGGDSFTLFGKGPKWGQDLYANMLAPHFREDVYAETWSNGVGTMNSSCSTNPKAFNVLNVQMDGVTWPRSKDHSKWAVSNNWFFLGGINRQASQMRRGGGGWAINNRAIVNTFKKAVAAFEKCP